MTSQDSRPLEGVEAYLFDVFGTVVDWHGSVSRSLTSSAPPELADEGHCYDMLLDTSANFPSIRLGNFRQGMAYRIHGIHVRIFRHSPVPAHSFHSCSLRVASGGPGSNNVDIMHREVCDSLSWMPLHRFTVSKYAARQILDSMLVSAKWSHLAPHYDESKRRLLVDFWHKLDGSLGFFLVRTPPDIANMLTKGGRTVVQGCMHLRKTR